MRYFGFDFWCNFIPLLVDPPETQPEHVGEFYALICWKGAKVAKCHVFSLAIFAWFDVFNMPVYKFLDDDAI